ncbi:MAG TPA: molybdopterin cofactor-binding domain-containing protein [Allosphingosinicella sp.]|jgi:isoquinoline 1-oxidoreductase beta subunit
MASSPDSPKLSRRTLLVGGGVGVGLLVAWRLWPREYGANLRAGPGERVFNAFLKIGSDGRVIVAVPQVELGQGTWTALPQVLADALGADWRTVGVEPAPVSPLYANTLLAEDAAEDGLPGFAQGIARWAGGESARRGAMMLTGGSTSVRAFEPKLREAGAAARALLMQAAAAKWGVDWEGLDTAAGFVTDGARKIAFAEIAEAAAGYDVPEFLPARGGSENRLVAQPLTRLDAPSKVDGTAQFAGDIRLPGMVFASARAGPSGQAVLQSLDRTAALRVPGVTGVVDSGNWVAVLASNWWAANRGVEALKTVWNGPQPMDSAGIDAALQAALEKDEGRRVFGQGALGEAYAGGNVLQAFYSVGPAANAPMETLSATARFSGGRLEIWAAAQAPGVARAAAARAIGIGEDMVTLYQVMGGGGYGRRLETAAIEQAAVLAAKTKKPVQLTWSRIEESVQDSFRPPARARMNARLGEGGMVLGWQAQIAAPDLGAALVERLGPGVRPLAANGSAVAGAVPPYAIPAVAVDHLPARVGMKIGAWRSGAHSYTSFFTESFMDELSRVAGVEPLSFRMQMLGANPRLARCLSSAAALGGWDGGQSGSAMGLACHSAFGSHIATVVEVEVGADQRPRVLRAVSAVDVGRVINPDIVKQQVEGGLIFGIAAAVGNPIGFGDGRPEVRGFRDIDFVRLANAPEVTVEIVESEEEPGGVTELGVPTAAPAIANALFALTGRRLRSLPLTVGA